MARCLPSILCIPHHFAAFSPQLVALAILRYDTFWPAQQTQSSNIFFDSPCIIRIRWYFFGGSSTSVGVGTFSGSSICAGVGTFSGSSISPDVNAGSGSRTSPDVGAGSGSSALVLTLMLAVVVALVLTLMLAVVVALVLGWYFQW
ncbi:APG_G0006640.mRNA.1.CDS.1 [Saccharomyces cerevisiae]|nr:APG_G0006640.mRNA.1.CDS.1 [Saccharomyces cerevisiae]CAI7057906.1 APG_G0006640.mRNA.1.CDS.1 [Saccharomyces cerevisiae]